MFTSSAALYAVGDGDVADEASPSYALGHSARTDRLLQAEQEAVRVGGCALRLVGLYHSLRRACAGLLGLPQGAERVFFSPWRPLNARMGAR